MMKKGNELGAQRSDVLMAYIQYVYEVLNEELNIGYSCLRNYICKKSMDLYFLMLHALRSFVVEMKLKLHIGSSQSHLVNTNLKKFKLMKSSAVNNGIKVTAGSFALYALLIVALWSVKSLVPNSANLISGDSGGSMMNQNVLSVTTKNDSTIVLNVVNMFNKKLLHVSVNSSAIGEGKLKIIDINGREVLSANIEIIRYPYYATVDITALSNGSYVLAVKSPQGIHSTNLIIE